jgi:DNA-binding MarR family transcriptional regulator/N-acetylglutamate synthase-like GNAT family acetyltransferase
MNVDRQISGVRAFNRFYTRQVGLLDEGLHSSPYTLTEVRVLYELAHGPGRTPSDIASFLHLDQGYLSRILRKFEDRGLLRRERSSEDARSSRLSLTPAGEVEFAPLNRASSEQVGAMLAPLSVSDRRRLLHSMTVVERLLTDKTRPSKGSFILRSHQPGDIGWAIQRHGEIYADEFGWNEEFEGLVAAILGAFLQKHDPERERCWIAENEGERAGCVFLVRNAERADTAQLRCLLVEASARGLGIGQALVEACVNFAREVGYRRIILWTNDVLVAARRIYEAAGFILVEEEPHHSFGRNLVGQTWAMNL